MELGLIMREDAGKHWELRGWSLLFIPAEAWDLIPSRSSVRLKREKFIGYFTQVTSQVQYSSQQHSIETR